MIILSNMMIFHNPLCLQSDDYGLQPIHKNSDSSDEADPDDLPRKVLIVNDVQSCAMMRNHILPIVA